MQSEQVRPVSVDKVIAEARALASSTVDRALALRLLPGVVNPVQVEATLLQ